MTFGQFIKENYSEELKITTFSRLQIAMIEQYVQTSNKEVFNLCVKLFTMMEDVGGINETLRILEKEIKKD